MEVATKISSSFLIGYTGEWWQTQKHPPDCSIKKGVFKNVPDFKRKHMCWSESLFNNASKFIKNRLQHKCFPVKFVKF